MDGQKQRHKVWRKNAKKLQRKRRRRLAAAKRDEELKRLQQSPSYEIKQAQERALELVQLENIERMNEIEHNKWVESEIQIEARWKERKSKIEEQAKRVEAERQRIQKEFEAEQKRFAEAAEEKKRLIEEQKQREIDLENRIQAYLEHSIEMPPELMVEAETNPGKETCPYFTKTATCRFGNKCTKNHKKQKISKILMLPGFFSHIHLEQSQDTEYGGDLSLEHDDIDLYEKFKEFFVDIVPEFERFGQIENLVVCKNYEPQLRGHVFVEYSSEREALRAQRVMNGRYYAGRMLNVEFCKITWRSAVCGRSNPSRMVDSTTLYFIVWSDIVAPFLNNNIGLSVKNTCQMGRKCRYFHIFKNPCDLYSVIRTIRQSYAALMNSHRNGSTVNDEKDSWNSNDERSRRNWRWSESPIRETVQKNATNSNSRIDRKESTKDRDRRRSRSRRSNSSSSRSSDRTRNRSVSRTHSRRSSHSRDKHSKRSKKRSRSRSKKRRKRSSSRQGSSKKHKHKDKDRNKDKNNEKN